MRTLNFVLPVTLLMAIGCQVPPPQATPIIGDSMTVGSFRVPDGYGYPPGGGSPVAGSIPPEMMVAGDLPPDACGAGCQPDAFGALSDTACLDEGCTSWESCTGSLPPGQPCAPSAGCAGTFCDGRCLGRCRMAYEQHLAQLRAKQEHLRQVLASQPIRTHVMNAATRHCEGATGPSFGAVTYPYYTTRGPRDFLMANPPSIGP